VEIQSHAEIAYKKIKEAILKHEIVPGESLSQEELALRLRVGETPVREALSRLTRDGYMTRRTNDDYRVSEISAEEAIEFFDLRQMLESYCIDEAIRRLTPDGLAALEHSVKFSHKSIVKNCPLIDRYLTNQDFHLALAQIAGNSAVCRVLADTCEKLVFTRPVDAVSHGGFAVLRYHRDILRALKLQDRNKAQELMKAHLDEIKYTLLKQIALRTRLARAR
jgi:DNA-binding GntR family transcriptional regulator